LVLFAVAGCGETQPGGIDLYVAPEARGAGSGDEGQAAGYTDALFWQRVQELLGSREVTVFFEDGSYEREGLVLDGMGHPDHRLTVRGASAGGAVLEAPVAVMLYLRGCRNILLVDLHFRGDVREYGLLIEPDGTVASRDIVVEGCSFMDLGAIELGALGIREGSHHVSVKSSTFERVGFDPHGHMIYAEQNVHHLEVSGNHFEDCSGDYVRFRNNADYTTTADNTFVHTGTFPHDDPWRIVFLRWPLFNTTDPGTEIFATNHAVASNSFTFAAQTDRERVALSILHWGYDTPGFHLLLTAEEGEILENGSPEAVRELLLSCCGLDLEAFLVCGNLYENCDVTAEFVSSADFGAESKGWDGQADISAALDEDPACRE
jgi:hypothetical protein